MENSFDPCENFIVLVTESHIVAAAMKLLKMSKLNDKPCKEYAPLGDLTWTENSRNRKSVIDRIIDAIVDKYVRMQYNETSNVAPTTRDGVLDYATNLLSLGCFYLEFRDAIKEGDGLHVLRCYRYMLPMFMSSGRTNYAIETLNMLLQHDFMLSPRLAEELIWGRFINTHGQAGKNIPNDLHCEHLNRLCKTCIADLGANKTKGSMSRVAQSLGTIHPVLLLLDINNNVNQQSSTHNDIKSTTDFKLMIESLTKNDIFSRTSVRNHASFSTPRDPLHAKNHEEVIAWIKEHTKNYFDN